MTLELFIVVLVVFSISALIKGWAGFGTNLIAMPILASVLGFGFDQSVVIVVSVGVFMNMAILIENKKFSIQRLSNIKTLVLFGVLFTFVGAYFLQSPSNQEILKVFAGFVVVFVALYRLYVVYIGIHSYIEEKTMSKYFIPTGIISGFFNGIAGLGGLPVLILLSNTNMDKDKFRTTLVSYFFVMNIVAVIGYFVSGLYTSFVINSISLLTLPSVFFCLVGVYLSRKVNDRVFSQVMLFVLLIMGINLILNGLFQSNIISIFL